MYPSYYYRMASALRLAGLAAAAALWVPTRNNQTLSARPFFPPLRAFSTAMITRRCACVCIYI